MVAESCDLFIDCEKFLSMLKNHHEVSYIDYMPPVYSSDGAVDGSGGWDWGWHWALWPCFGTTAPTS